MERDADQQSALEGAGWRVLRFWEHENPEWVAAKVAQAVQVARSGGEDPSGS
jgi:DNA mismatch endonuclease (patch repair protein)